MRNLLLAATALLAITAMESAKADVLLGGVNWTGNGVQLQLTPAVPPGNQPQNAPCLICGANQPQQPAGFGYNDYSNTGNLPSVTSFSDQGNGGRNQLANNTFGDGYQIGDGSLFKAFLLANGDTSSNLGFTIGVDVNSAAGMPPETLDAFYFLDFTQHTVLGTFTGTPNNLVLANNGTGFPDYTLTGFSLNGVNPGDTIAFVSRMSGLTDGPDSFFLEPGVAAPVPGPAVGSGLPGLAFALGGMVLLARTRQKHRNPFNTGKE